MRLSTLFSNLLVAIQLGSLPSFAHGRSLALLPDTLSHSLEARQVCRYRDCYTTVACLAGQAAIWVDRELDGAIELVLQQTTTGNVGLMITNGLGVTVRVLVSAFNGQFHDFRDIGTAGVNWIFSGSHFGIWHGNDVRLRVVYDLPPGRKRDLSLASSVQGEATVIETRDVPEKPHGAQPLHVDPKGHQATGVNDKKPKTVGGGACPGSCTGGYWEKSCKLGKCT